MVGMDGDLFCEVFVGWERIFVVGYTVVLTNKGNAQVGSRLPGIVYRILFRPVLGCIVSTIERTNYRSVYIIANCGRRVIRSCLPTRVGATCRGPRLNANRTIVATETFIRRRGSSSVLVLGNSNPLVSRPAVGTTCSCRGDGRGSVALISTVTSSARNVNRVGHSRGNGLLYVIRRGSTGRRRGGVHRSGTNAC